MLAGWKTVDTIVDPFKNKLAQYKCK